MHEQKTRGLNSYFYTHYTALCVVYSNSAWPQECLMIYNDCADPNSSHRHPPTNIQMHAHTHTHTNTHTHTKTSDEREVLVNRMEEIVDGFEERCDEEKVVLVLNGACRDGRAGGALEKMLERRFYAHD